MRLSSVLTIVLLPLVMGCSGSETPAPKTATLAFGSCADMGEVTAPTWNAIVAEAPDAMITLGDTPYIDSTDPDRQRERYEAFAKAPGFIAVTNAMTLYGTWDDHDFGRNDTDGNLAGKENSRAAFIEHYSPFGNTSFGNGTEGVYTSFVEGNIEVFLLDTRYFAGTKPSEFNPEQRTLLGADQWAWLRKGLETSQADFKVLACGMIWNGAVRPGKPDHWGSYPAEYKGLMTFIGNNDIDGVVLVGGDIHRSRCIVHNTQATAGYDIPEFITSPMHNHIIATANQPHEGLQFDTGTPNSYLLLKTKNGESGQSITASFMTAPKPAEQTSKGKQLYTFQKHLQDLSKE